MKQRGRLSAGLLGGLGLGAVLAAGAAGVAGCLPDLGGGGGGPLAAGYEGAEGRVWRNYESPPRAVRDAALKVLRGMGARIEKDAVDVLGGTLEARRVTGETIRFTLKIQDGKTRVGVRTQHFGGRAKDQAIHEELAKKLR